MKDKQSTLKAPPLKSLIRGYKASIGRNNTGRITSWHRSGKRHTRTYREIDFQRESTHGIVVGLEYDPNRGAFLARIFNPDSGEHRYILAPTNLNRGDIVRSDSEQAKIGHSLRLRYTPTGSLIFNLSTRPGRAGKLIRAPGAFATLIKRTDASAQVQLKSGQKYWLDTDTLATIGSVSNASKRFQPLYKAGQSRWAGWRPVVRGVAMNPVDHPHGGGEGKTSGGRPSVSPWGKPVRGKPTKRRKIHKKQLYL